MPDHRWPVGRTLPENSPSAVPVARPVDPDPPPLSDDEVERWASLPARTTLNRAVVSLAREVQARRAAQPAREGVVSLDGHEWEVTVPAGTAALDQFHAAGAAISATLRPLSGDPEAPQP